MTLKPSPAPSRNTPPGVAESATLMTTRALPVLPPAPLEAPCRHSESYDTAFAAHIHRYLLALRGRPETTHFPRIPVLGHKNATARRRTGHLGTYFHLHRGALDVGVHLLHLMGPPHTCFIVGSIIILSRSVFRTEDGSASQICAYHPQ